MGLGKAMTLAYVVIWYGGVCASVDGSSSIDDPIEIIKNIAIEIAAVLLLTNCNFSYLLKFMCTIQRTSNI